MGIVVPLEQAAVEDRKVTRPSVKRMNVLRLNEC